MAAVRPRGGSLARNEGREDLQVSSRPLAGARASVLLVIKWELLAFELQCAAPGLLLILLGCILSNIELQTHIVQALLYSYSAARR